MFSATQGMNQKKKHPAVQMISGAIAGFVESSICHPLDTIKTRMQIRKQQSAIDMARARSSLHEPDVMRALSSLAEPRIILTQEAARARQSLDGTNQLSRNRLHEPASLTNRVPSTLGKVLPSFDPTMKTRSPLVAATLGPFGTAKRIIEREGFLSLYKGLTAVYFGIIPKMSLRFFAFEQYRDVLLHFADNKSTSSNQYVSSINFFAGLLSGLTEAVVIVTPAEVCKIRMQAQYNSLVDPAQVARRKYTNVIQTAAVLVREEGVGALYKGVVATMLRQGCNQAVNFSTYNWFKKLVLERESTGPGGAKELKHWQSLLLGGISGGFGPVINNPLDVVKTRTQKQIIIPGKDPKYKGIIQSCRVIAQEEGVGSLWRGLTPRLLRIVPGQAITFMTYESISSILINHKYFE